MMVNVYDWGELDSRLKAIWDGMKQALAGQDVETAVSYFTANTKELYSDIFNALYDSLPQLVNEMEQQESNQGGFINIIYATGNKAKYRIIRDEVISGNTYPITYYIYFEIGDDGLWKIYRY